jgi:hypothetical protein
VPPRIVSNRRACVLPLKLWLTGCRMRLHRIPEISKLLFSVNRGTLHQVAGIAVSEVPENLRRPQCQISGADFSQAIQ